MHAIDINQLTKRYGKRVGIAQLDLTIPEGVIFGFLGPNGAGKTTVIRSLMGFLKPSEGYARILGKDCWRHSPDIKREVGYLPGDWRLPPWMTPKWAIRISAGTRQGRGSEEGHRLLNELDLPDTLRFHQMSRGMRQKLGLVLALMHRPRLLILDEPTTGLDPITQNALYSHLRELSTQGHTVFFSSHVLREVEVLCSHVGIVREGRLVIDEPIDTLRARARRIVHIEWSEGSMIPPIVPSMLKLEHCSGRTWQCRLTGSAPDLLDWLNRQNLHDVSIMPPDLEELFHQLYQTHGKQNDSRTVD